MSFPPNPDPGRLKAHAPDDNLPLREMHLLVGGRCRDCGRPYAAREALGSVALGFKDAPRCLPCLAGRLGRAAAELRADLVDYVRRRECYARAWAEAERLDGPAPDWPPLAERPEGVVSESTPPSEPAPPSAAWVAGDMGCGELVMALRGRLNGLPPGAVLKVIATDPAAPEDLPAWCRLTGNTLVAHEPPRVSHPPQGELTHARQVLCQPDLCQGQPGQGDRRLCRRQRGRRVRQGDGRLPEHRGRSPRRSRATPTTSPRRASPRSRT